jgi:hypothetical protein
VWTLNGQCNGGVKPLEHSGLKGEYLKDKINELEKDRSIRGRTEA